MTDKELIRQAIDHLDNVEYDEAREALVEILQQPKLKPVAWMMTNAVGKPYFRKNPQDKVFNPRPLYALPPPREWQGLTEQEITSLLSWSIDLAVRHPSMSYSSWQHEFAQAIQAQLKDQNT